MSLDEKRYGHDAESGITTTNYLLVGDNAYGYSATATLPAFGLIGDLDAYFIRVDPGMHYSIVTSSSSPLYNPSAINTNFLLLDRYGYALASSTDFGTFSGLSFTAADSLYYVQVYSDSIGNYSLRLTNDSITEVNPIGQNLPIGVTLNGYLDYTSDVDIFAFAAVAGAVYGFTLVSSIADAYLDIEYSNVQVANLVSRGSGVYVFTASVSGIFDLHISSNSLVNRGPYTISYSELDVLPPVITASTPDIGGTTGAAQNLSLVFSETIQRGPGNVVLRSVTTGAVVETFSVASSPRILVNGQTLTIDPTSDLQPGVQYRVEVSSDAVRDLAGNAFAGSVAWTFSTQALANTAPVSSNGSASTKEDSVLVGTLPIAVDANGDQITYAKVSDASKGGVSVAANGQYTYTPFADFNGADSFGFSVSDGRGGTNTYKLEISVIPANDAPTGSISVTGEARVNQELTATSTLMDVDGLGTLSFQWLRDGSAIPSATGSSYKLTSQDLGAVIGVRASYLDGGGTLETASSQVTGKVQGAAAIVGTEGNDNLKGSSLSDVIEGRGGNDLLDGGQGNDDLNGGTGIDTAVMPSRLADANVSGSSGVFSITTPQGGTDRLTSIERVKFDDTSVALDLSGNAGVVAKVLGAVFGKASVHNEVYAGIGLYYADGGMSYSDLMTLAIGARLGVGASHRAIVDLLYTNVVGVAPAEADAAYFVGLLDSLVYSVSGLGILAADTDLNAANIELVALTQTGLVFMPFVGP